jgi:UDP-3-O-[3-hydroxymyristoyl] N-acetylglucosamine deacetylase
MSVTIKREIVLEGIGLHSGEHGRVALYPSDKPGIYFKTGTGLYSLTSAVVEENKRLTGFRLPDGTLVRTAEHLLGSIAGMGVDSIIIELAGEEVPILDGSALPFASAIDDAGIEIRGEKKRGKALMGPVFVEDTDRRRFVAAAPSDKLRITYVIDYSGTPIGTQRVCYDIEPDVFLATISRARTFGLTSEIDYLNKAGLAKGGSLDNCLVFDEKALLNEGGLRFPLECATHKVIDFLGDLILSGSVPVAHYIAVCAGHDMHGKLTNRLKRIYPENQEKL